MCYEVVECPSCCGAKKFDEYTSWVTEKKYKTGRKVRCGLCKGKGRVQQKNQIFRLAVRMEKFIE